LRIVDLLAIDSTISWREFRGAGHELQDQLIAQGHRLPIIFVTAFLEMRARARALAAGATCFLAKPFSDEELITCLSEALPGWSV
jgi:FixJ family two-component response regulator